MRRVFSRPSSLPRGPGEGGNVPQYGDITGISCAVTREWEEGTTRNRGGGEGDLTEFANQISSLVYEILGRKEKGAGTLLAFVPIIVPKPTFYPPPHCSCVAAVAFKPAVSATKLLPFGNNSGGEEISRDKDFFFPAEERIRSVRSPLRGNG